MRRRLDKLFGSIPDSVLNAIGLISGIITILSVIPILIKLIRLLFKGEFSFSLLSNIHIALVLICLLNIWLMFKIVKYRKIQAETREVFSKSYYQLLRGYRNSMGEIGVSKPNRDTVCNQVMNFSIDTLDTLCNIFQKLTRQEVSGCIKIIEPSDELEYTTATVKTFCRSRNSDPQRDEYDNKSPHNKTIISENTDFNSIVQPGKTKGCFYKQDLEAYQKQLEKDGEEYLNSNPYWKKYYKATIVAPIRIANKRNPMTELQESYTILGFLCVDSLSTHAFEESQSAYYKSIIKSFAALLYSVLEIYKLNNETISDNAPQSDQAPIVTTAPILIANRNAAQKDNPEIAQTKGTTAEVT